MQKTFKVLHISVGNIATVMSTAGAFVVLVMVLIGVIGVVSRYFVGHPVSWTDETITYLIPLYVALCAGELLIRNKHISIEMLPKLKYVVEFSLFAISLLLFISAIRMVNFTFEFGLYLPGELGVQAWLIQICLPIGAALMTLITGLNLVSNLTTIDGAK